MDVFMCASVCVHMCLCMYLHLWVTVCIYMCTCYGYACACMYMGMCMYIYTHMCLCTCMCVFIHMYVIEVERIMEGNAEILWWRGGRRGDRYTGHAITKGGMLRKRSETRKQREKELKKKKS